jgi:hypothetical protein
MFEEVAISGAAVGVATVPAEVLALTTVTCDTFNSDAG